MHHEAILYSLDKKVTLTQLKNKEYPEYAPDIYKKLEDWTKEQGVSCMIDTDKDFHYKLFSIRPKTHILYYMGDIGLLNQKLLAIVGPRKMSIYSKQVLEKLFAVARDYNIVTISGMAEGVDQLCHHLSQEYNIPTIAVLGGGIGRYLRKQEAHIIKKIVANGGLVLSEYKLFDSPTLYSFPQRNRFVAGLADLLFLPEAGKKSGSLITVDFALEMKKPVYATPNSIFAEHSLGILEYMQSGRVQAVFDFPKLFSSYFSSKKNISRTLFPISLTDQEQSLLSIFSHDQGIEIQDILQKTGGNLQEYIQLLTLLEIKGLLIQSAPGKYILA